MTPPLVLRGDCADRMADLGPSSISAIVTDPPYGLSFMGKGWDSMGHGNAQQAWHARWLTEALRVLKPGGYLVAFGGTRTVHRLVCAAEDVGFEVRDLLTWHYGQGFPKSLNVGKAIDKAAGAPRKIVGTQRTNVGMQGGNFTAGSKSADVPITQAATDEARQWEGWGTALKPATEPILLARKPLSERTVAANVLKHGTAGLNIDGCRISTEPGDEVSLHGRSVEAAKGNQSFNPMPGQAKGQTPSQAKGRYPANLLLTHHPECVETIREVEEVELEILTDEDGQAYTRPDRGKTRRTRTVTTYDCHPDCPARIMDEQSGPSGARDPATGPTAKDCTGGVYGGGRDASPQAYKGDPLTGASRFFYTSKANNRERWGYCHTCEVAFCRGDKEARKKHKACEAPEGRKRAVEWHPTVKPVSIMRWLVRLVTPPGGLVLDPFGGTGTTGVAAMEEGFDVVVVERNPVYAKIARARLEAVEDA